MCERSRRGQADSRRAANRVRRRIECALWRGPDGLPVRPHSRLSQCDIGL
jgi:hypothetical protein